MDRAIVRTGSTYLGENASFVQGADKGRRTREPGVPILFRDANDTQV